MAKKGMKRPNSKESYSTESNKKNQQRKNEVEEVPEITNSAKAGNNNASNQNM